MNSSLLRIAACLLGAGAVAVAQGNRPAPLNSPVVHADRTVTFSVRAPNAKKVELSAQFLKANQALTSDTNGVWSITVGPVEPNLYPYNFVIDGIGVADSANQELFPNERFKAKPRGHSRRNTPSLHAIQDVPHGEMTYALLSCRETLNRTRPLIVLHAARLSCKSRGQISRLLPRQRDDGHGGDVVPGGSRQLHPRQSYRAEEGRADDCGHALRQHDGGHAHAFDLARRRPEMYKVFSDELVGNVMPYVEANFRTLSRDRETPRHRRVLARRWAIAVHRLQQPRQVRVDWFLQRLPHAGSVRQILRCGGGRSRRRRTGS